MRLHCHRPSLAAAFQVVSSVVPARTPKDILKNVKLQVDKTAATLIGTDQEVGIRYEIPGVEVEATGETLLNCGRVQSILRELTQDGVDIEVKSDRIQIRSGQSEFKLLAADPAEFPPVTAFEDTRYHVLPGQGFREAIRRTIFATDVESTRYALGGIHLDLEPDAVTLAATDSRRLAVMKCACRSEGIDEVEHADPVIPSKAMTLIERSIGDTEEDVLLAVHENDALVKCGNSTIYSRLVEGRFPKYRDVIPRQCPLAVDFVVGPFYSVVRQAQIVTNEESRGVDFNFSEGQLTLTSQAVDIGESTIELPIAFEGKSLTITLDPRFVAEYLRVFEPESQVRFEFTNSESAAVFRTEDGYIYVVMPLMRERP